MGYLWDFEVDEDGWTLDDNGGCHNAAEWTVSDYADNPGSLYFEVGPSACSTLGATIGLSPAESGYDEISFWVNATNNDGDPHTINFVVYYDDATNDSESLEVPASTTTGWTEIVITLNPAKNVNEVSVSAETEGVSYWGNWYLDDVQLGEIVSSAPGYYYGDTDLGAVKASDLPFGLATPDSHALRNLVAVLGSGDAAEDPMVLASADPYAYWNMLEGAAHNLFDTQITSIRWGEPCATNVGVPTGGVSIPTNTGEVITIPPGDPGQVLTPGEPGSPPTWQDPTVDWSRVSISTIGSPSRDYLDELISSYLSVGYVDGGEITDNLDGTIDIATGAGWIRATDDDQDIILSFEWGAVTSLALTVGQRNYIYVNYNSGSPTVLATTNLGSLDHSTNFVLALVFAETNHVHVAMAGQRLNDFIHRFYYHSYEHDGLERSSGLVTSETGTRNLDITAGVLYWALYRITTSAFDSSGADTFDYYYQDGLGDWTEVTGQTQIDNTYWDDGTGTLNTLTVNRYGVHWVFMTPDGDIYVLYGRGDYTLAQAQEAGIPATMPVELSDFSILIAKIIIQQGASSFYSVEYPWTTTFQTGGGVSDHNSLSGLQGGTAAEYYHLTAAEYAALGSGGNAWPLAGERLDEDGASYASLALLIAALGPTNPIGYLGPGQHTEASGNLVLSEALRGITATFNMTQVVFSGGYGFELQGGATLEMLSVQSSGGAGDVEVIEVQNYEYSIVLDRVNVTGSGTTNFDVYALVLPANGGTCLLRDCDFRPTATGTGTNYAISMASGWSGLVIEGGYFSGDIDLNGSGDVQLLGPIINGSVSWTSYTNGWYIDEVTGDTHFVTNGVDDVHSEAHERGGANEMDGDHLDIDYTPTNYTPSTTPSEANSVDDLAAHLYGIDQALGAGSSAALSFDAYLSADQTGVATGTWTKIEADTETFDTEGEYDATTNFRHTPTTAGKWLYIVIVQVFDLGDADQVYSAVYKNGSRYRQVGISTGAGFSGYSITTAILDMNGSTDYAEAYAYHNYGGNRSLFSGSRNTSFAGVFLGS